MQLSGQRNRAQVRVYGERFLNDGPRHQLYRAELSQMLADWQTAGASADQ